MFEYPSRRAITLRRRLGLALRKLGLKPPELTDPYLDAKVRELELAQRNNTVERPFNYGDGATKSYLGYADGRISATSDHTFYPRLFYTAIRDALRIYPELRAVINFGAFYANVDATLALLHSEIRFLAVDIGAEIKTLNEQMFAGRNLHFINSTIEPVVSGNQFRPAILAHCKTATLCYPHKISELYKLAAKSGVTHIIGVENTGFCRGIGDFYDFTTEPKPSAYYKSTMYVHNYPAFLKEAGYKIVDGRINYNGENHAICFTARLS